MRKYNVWYGDSVSIIYCAYAYAEFIVSGYGYQSPKFVTWNPNCIDVHIIYY